MTTWTKFNEADQTTWPPKDRLVLTHGIYGDYALGLWYPDPDSDGGGNWYDENSDLDDGWEPAQPLWWHRLPLQPKG